MAYKISEDCISCGACEPECKNQAIKEGESVYDIDPNKCTECVGWFAAPKCAEVCPVEACVSDSAHKETRDQLLKKWESLHPGQKPA